MANENDSTQKKVKEIVDLMSKFTEANPLVTPSKKDSILNNEPETDFTVVESSRTLTYSQRGWHTYGELVRHP